MTSRVEIAEGLRRFLKSEFPGRDVELTDSTRLLDEWFLDSLGVVSTVLFLEKTFDVRLSRADVSGQNFETVDSLTNLVLSRLGS